MEGLFAGVVCGSLRAVMHWDRQGFEAAKSPSGRDSGQWGDAVFWTEGWKVAAAPAKLSKDQKRTAGTVPQLPQGSTHSADEKTDGKAAGGKQSSQLGPFAISLESVGGRGLPLPAPTHSLPL